MSVTLSALFLDNRGSTAPARNSALPPCFAALQRKGAVHFLLDRQQRCEAADPFLASWPDTPPPLPTASEPSELTLASDPSLGPKADEAFFWLDEQYWALRSAASDHGAEGEAPVAVGDFNEAMAQVWSRCLRLSAGAPAVRLARGVAAHPLLEMVALEAVDIELVAASCPRLLCSWRWSN